MPNRTLLQLCQKIEAGYASGLTMYDAGMIGAAEELTSRTAEIGQLITASSQAHASVAQAQKPVEIEMGFRPDMIEVLLSVAKTHGEDCDPDHEVGDLQDLLRPMWSVMTPTQQRDFLASEEVATMLSGAAAVNADGDDDLVLLTAGTVDKLDETEWESACAQFGLDTSFVYPDDSVVEIINAFRCDHLRDDKEEQAQMPGLRQS